MTSWHFDVYSEAYGTEQFGPYDTKDDATAGVIRVKLKAAKLNDSVERIYSMPYDDSVLPTDEVLS
jgi:hypothetical protein